MKNHRDVLFLWPLGENGRKQKERPYALSVPTLHLSLQQQAEILDWARSDTASKFHTSPPVLGK
jgi:hypothetical protein